MIFKQVTAKLFGKAGGRSPGVWLGAFGKHPGWNDHMDDQGLETERLIAAKRVIYMEGIAAAIDSGAWDKLEPGQRIEDFGHEFIWRIGPDILAGRLWSSRDGKGRTKYPLVLCLQCRDVPLEWIFDHAMPSLMRLEDRLRRDSSADAVVSSINGVRSGLREAASQQSRGAEPTGASGRLAILVKRPEFGADQAGLLRILYQAEREWGSYLAGSHETSRVRTDTTERSYHLRVPGCAERASDRLRVWFEFASKVTASWVSCFLAAPVHQSWVDMVVGQPVGPQLFCLKANESRIPLSSDIPYNMDAQTVALMRRKAAALGSG